MAKALDRLRVKFTWKVGSGNLGEQLHLEASEVVSAAAG